MLLLGSRPFAICKLQNLFNFYFKRTKVYVLCFTVVTSLHLVTCNLRLQSQSGGFAVFTKYSNSDGACSGSIESSLAFAIGECVPIKDFTVTGYNSIIVNYEYFLISVTSYSSTTCTGATTLTGPVPPTTCVTSVRMTYSGKSTPPVTTVTGKYMQLR